MSYPEPTYHGDTGEVSAYYRPTGHAPELVYANGTRIHYLATGETTAGGYGLYRYEMAGNGGPGPHFHRTISESFYTLSGTIQIYNGDKWIDTEPGDFVHVPAGGIHGFRNQSGEAASMLIHFAPGAPREAYFEGLVGIGEFTEEQRADFMLYHDNIWV